jgi:hypothetical protein
MASFAMRCRILLHQSGDQVDYQGCHDMRDHASGCVTALVARSVQQDLAVGMTLPIKQG